MKNSIFARFARAFFIFWHFVDVLVLSTTWNELFCSCVDDVSIRRQMFNFVSLCPKRWFQFNSTIVRTHFSSIRSLNNWKMIAETRSHIFRWRYRFRRHRVCLSSLLSPTGLSSGDQTGAVFLSFLCEAQRTETRVLISPQFHKCLINFRWDLDFELVSYCSNRNISAVCC